MAKVWKRGEKAQTVISTMEANRGKSYDEVVGILVKVLDTTEFDARAYYRYMVRHGKVEGIEKTWKMGKRSTGTKVTKARRQADKVLKAVAKAQEKSAEEVAAVKAKNLETMRAVSAKLGKVRDHSVVNEQDDGATDLDPYLTREDVDYVLREEKLIGNVPRYADLEG